MRKYQVIILLFFLFLLLEPFTLSASEMTKADSLLAAKKHFSFAVQYKKAGNYQQSLDNYQQSIAYNDTVYQVHYSFADLLMKMNRPLDARREYLISFTLEPTHYNSASMLAKLYHEAAMFDSALVIYETMHRLKPQDKELLASIAALRDYLGKKSDALDAYTELIKSGEDSFENLMHAVSLAVALEDWKRAETFIAQALLKQPGDKEVIHTAVQISLELNDLASASGFLHQLAVIDSTDLAVIGKFEMVSRMSGDTQNLVWALELHHRLSPRDSEILGELAELLFREGKTENGLKYLTRGLQISPEDGRLRILNGDYYRRKGDTDKALQEYTIALKDEKWRSSAQQCIWQIKPPQSEAEKAEQEFFRRGKKNPE